MLQGIDVSKWQKSDVIKNSDCDFCIIKATEGRTYTDPSFKMHAEVASAEHKLLGFYHYARPDNGNTPLQEVENFYNTVRAYVGSAIFAIDWEGDSLNIEGGENWLLQFCSHFYNLSGVLPMIYMSEYVARQEKYKIVKHCGLWVANRSEKVSSGVWDFWAIHQYSSTPYDKNVFNGTIEQWYKYAEVQNNTVKDEKDNSGNSFCGCCCCHKNE